LLFEILRTRLKKGKDVPVYALKVYRKSRGRLQLKCDGTRWLRERKWRGNWRMEWVASTLHTTSEHGVSSITTADGHTSAASRRLNWRTYRFKWTRPFRGKTKSGFCACAITLQTQSTAALILNVGTKRRWVNFTLRPSYLRGKRLVLIK